MNIHSAPFLGTTTRPSPHVRDRRRMARTARRRDCTESCSTPSSSDRPRRTTHREVPRRPRRARRCRRLGCPQPPGPPERPGPRRPAHRGQRRRAWCSPPSTTRPRPAPRSPAEVADEGRALVSGRLLADICRSLPAKPVDMVLDGARVSLTCGSARFSLQTMPVEDYPTPARHAGRDRHGRRATRSRTPSPRRSPPPAATTCCRAHRRPDRDRRLDDLAAGHRPVPALATASSTGTRAPPTSRVAALVPARVLGDTAKSLTAGSEVTIALAGHRLRRGHHRLRGRGPGGVRRTTTRLLDGEFPKVRSLFPSEHLTVGAGRQGRADRVGQARRAGRRAQHRGPARVQRRRAHPRRRLRRRGPGLGVDRGRDRRRGHHHRLQPAVPARRAHRDRRGRSSSSRSPRRPSRS